jgi:hypothetical protein
VWRAPVRYFLAYLAVVFALGGVIFLENRTPAEQVANNGFLNLPTAVTISVFGASVLTLIAARHYHLRRRPLRFGPIGTTLMLLPLWTVAAFALFDRLYWGTGS